MEEELRIIKFLREFGQGEPELPSPLRILAYYLRKEVENTRLGDINNSNQHRSSVDYTSVSTGRGD